MTKIIQFGITALAVMWHCFAYANPQITHTDYSPTYRILDQQGFISHIDYSKEELIFHICYINKEGNTDIQINTDNWTLSSTSRSSLTFDYEAKTIKNIRWNDELQKLSLCKGGNKTITARRGDAVTFQVHFARPDERAKLVNVTGVDMVSYYDILLKGADSQFLGNYQYLPNRMKIFYSDCDYVRHSKTLQFTNLDEELKRLTLAQLEQNNVEEAKQAVTYLPKSLEAIEDLVCKERIILNDIYFQENSANYQGHSASKKTLNIIIQYMNKYPEAKLILHGHTDVLGNAEHNLQLSKDRVAMVKRTLRVAGVNPDRVITLAYGGTQPLIDAMRGGERNRRVEAEILCPVELDLDNDINISDIKHDGL